jgi:hypothetical protein
MHQHWLSSEDSCFLHCRWQASVDLAIVRCTDDVAPNARKRVTDISACSVAGDIAGSGVPLSITAGWLDSTAGPAIIMFMKAAKASGVWLVWTGVLPHQRVAAACTVVRCTLLV